jgi:hypothetical protein
MSETSEQLKARTEAFAIAVIKFCDAMPNTLAGRRIKEAKRRKKGGNP